jgi:hypothetical protein
MAQCGKSRVNAQVGSPVKLEASWRGATGIEAQCLLADGIITGGWRRLAILADLGMNRRNARSFHSCWRFVLEPAPGRQRIAE